MLPEQTIKKVLTAGCQCNPPLGGIARVEKSYLDHILVGGKFIPTAGGDKLSEKIKYAVTATLKMICTLLTNRNIKIVHIHTAGRVSFPRAVWFQNIAKCFGRKTVMHVHAGSFRNYYHKNPSFVRRNLRRSDAIIALSKLWKDFFEDELQLKNVFIVDNVVEPPQQQQLAPSDLVHATFLGLIHSNKGIYDLLDAINRCKAQLKGKFLLHVAGRGEVDNLQQIINENDLGDIVVYEGWADDEKKAQLLSQASIFILPSYIEGLPISILEAMSYGLATIATPVGGVPEIINAENGFIVMPGDIKNLADTIMHCVDNPEMVAQKGSVAQNQVKKHYPIEVEKQLEEVYNYLLTEK